jgi:hypothetical protein
MNAPNEERKETENMELLKKQASDCGPGCGCHSTGAAGRMRRVLGVIVLVAAAVMVGRAVIKSNAASTEASTPAFGAPFAAPDNSTASSGESAKTAETSVGMSLGAFSELNGVAGKSDAVFIFVPGKDGASGNLPSAAMNSAARKLEAQGYKINLFTLKAASPDYSQVATQMSVPGVIAMVKGRGMNAISGEITEAKLIQGLVAASSAGGGCGPSTPGCGPSTPGCN